MTPDKYWSCIFSDIFGTHVVTDGGYWNGLRSWIVRVICVYGEYVVRIQVPDDNSWIRLLGAPGARIEISLADGGAYARLKAIARERSPFLLSPEGQRKIITG